MSTGTKLLSLFNIEPGEGTLVLLMLAHSFFIGSARIFTRSGAYALFLVEFTANDLPYIYVGIGIVVTLLSLLYLKLSEHLSFLKLLIANVIFLILSLLGFRLGLELGSPRWMVFVLPIWYEVLWTLTNLEYWNLAGRLFNVRQGKRLFGLIGAGGQVATIAGGFLVPLVVGFIGTPNLFVLAAVSMAGALIALFYTSSSFAPRLATPKEILPANRRKTSLSLLRNPYILAIFGLFALDIFTYFSIDKIFYAQAEIHFPTEDQLAGFVGVFFALCGLFSLLTRSFLTGQMISRYGVRMGLQITPILLLVTGILAAVIGTVYGALIAFFCFVALMRSLDLVLVESVDLPTLNVLYQPLPAVQRVQVQAMVEGIVYSLSIGLTGVALWILTTFVKPTTVQLIYIVLVFLLVWIGLAGRLGRMYPQALVRALSRRRLDGVELSLDDGSSIPILQRELKSSNVSAVLYASGLLESIKPEAFLASIPDLLAHPEPEVRQDILQRIERLCLNSAAQEVCKRIPVERSPVVLGTALRTMALLDSSGTFECVSAYLDHPDLQVRRGAIAGLLRSGGIEGVLAAGNKLLQIAKSTDPTERTLAAQVLGDVGASSFYQVLLPLLSDGAIPVRRAALLAAGQMNNPRLWPEVVDSLKNGAVRPAAVSALVSCGKAVVPEIIRSFDQVDQDRAVLADLLGRIGGEEAVAWLKDRIDYPDTRIRLHILRSLSRCGYQARGEEANPIRTHIDREVALSSYLLAVIAELEVAGQVAQLLQESFYEMLDRAQERIFFLLSLIYDSRSILAARDNLRLAGADRKAYALEALELMVSNDLKKTLFPLLGNLPADQKVQQLSEFYPQTWQNFEKRLREIISVSNVFTTKWTKACALYTIGRLSLVRLSDAAECALVEPDALVQETAAWTLSRLDPRRHSENGPDGYRESSETGKVPVRSVTMLSTVEKVIALKKASIFTAIPDETLADVAALLEEVTLYPGETIFEKGDLGDCMYIIVSGEVSVHDGDLTLNHLAEGDVFGEMAVLDAEPRLASVTAVSETRLLRLAQELLFDLMDEQPEVARRIIRVLSHHLRARVQDLNELRKNLDPLKVK